MKIFLKRNGAVSVFLVIVLVPMLVLTSVVVDVSRVNLGHAMAESAVDLTANTVLTNYDYQLKEIYGLMASSNNSEEFLKKIKDYYIDTIKASGLNDEDAEKLADDAVNIVKTADLENIDVSEEDFSVKVLQGDNGSLINPAITKAQIVNFMKYRAPIDLGTSIIDAVNLFKNMGKKTELIEKKNEYYEKHSSILEECQNARDAMYQYGDKYPQENQVPAKRKTQLDLDAEYVRNDIKEYLTSVYSEEYLINPREIHFEFDKKEKRWIWDKQPGKKYSRDFEITKPTAKKTNEIIKYIIQCENLQTFEKYSSFDTNDEFAINILEQFFREYKTNPSKSYLSLCFDLYCYLNSIEPDTTLTVDGSEMIAGDLLSDENNRFFTNLNNIYKKMDTAYRKYEQQKNNEKKSESGQKCLLARYESCQYHDELLGRLEAIEKLLESLKNIRSKVKELKSARNEWKSAANVSALKKDSMAQSDKQEIEELENAFKESEIDDFIAKAEAVKSTIETLKKAVEDYKLDDKRFIDFEGNGRDVLKYYCEHRSGWSEQDLKYPSKERWQEMVQESKTDVFGDNSDEFKTSFSGNADPSLAKPKSNFYQYLMENFKPTKEENETENKVKSKKKEIKKATDSTDSSAAAEEGKKAKGAEVKNSIKDKSNLPSKLWISKKEESNVLGDSESATTKKETALSGASSLMNKMFDGIAEKLRGARDNFYISDYIIQMFSYNTIEAEAGHGDSKKDLLTLTKIPIDRDHNYLYGGEVEYILYGNNGVAKAYASIYGIRFASNLIYAFSSSEIRAEATAIATAACGVPPLTALIPLAKIAIIVGVALVESGLDLVDLSEGDKVPLYKSAQTWKTSLSCGLKSLAATASEKIVDVAIDNGFEALEGWISSNVDDLSKKFDEKKEEFAGAVNKVVDSKIDGLKQDVIERFMDICNVAVAQKGNDAVDYVKDELKKWSNSADFGSDITNKIKEQAVNKLCSYDINGVLDKIKKGEKDKIDSMMNDLKGVVNSAVSNASNEISKVKDGLVDKLKDSSTEGAEKMKETLKNQLESKFGEATDNITSGTDTAMGSLLSWAYSDYLTLFLVIGTITNENKILLRMEDVIQMNMEKVKGDEGYLLKNSYVYYELRSKILVKPLLTTIPMINEYTKNDLTGENWYTVNCSMKFGY